MLECQEYLEARQKQCVERMCMKPSQATISDLDFMLWYKEALQDQEVCDNSSATCPKDVSSRLASNEEIQDFLHKDHLLDEKINFQLTLLNRKLAALPFDISQTNGNYKYKGKRISSRLLLPGTSVLGFVKNLQQVENKTPKIIEGDVSKGN